MTTFRIVTGSKSQGSCYFNMMPKGTHNFSAKHYRPLRYNVTIKTGLRSPCYEYVPVLRAMPIEKRQEASNILDEASVLESQKRVAVLLIHKLRQWKIHTAKKYRPIPILPYNKLLTSKQRHQAEHIICHCGSRYRAH